MRDDHRLKEKYEISLDSRQVVTLTVAVLVVLGGVFVLGVVVGKKLSAEARPTQPADLLTTLDQKATGLDEASQSDASLTFQDELTRKAPEPAPAPAVAAAQPKAPEERQPEAPKVDSGKLADAFAVAARPDAGTAPRVVEVKLPEAVREEPVTTRTRDGGALKDAFGRVQKPPETAPDGTWTLQLAAYQDHAEAERFAAGLRDKGYGPYLVEAAIPGKGTWFRVRLGHFASKDAATGYLNDFKRETSMPAIVTTTR